MSILRLHPGLRLSAIGGVVFIVFLVSLLVMPPVVSVIGMLAGGMGVWGGFLWTLFGWYGPTPPEGGET